MNVNKSWGFLLILVAAALFIAGCEEPVVPGQNGTTDWNITINDTVEPPITDGNQTTNDTKPDEEEIDESKASLKLEAVEGDLVEIPVKAVDPDGDYLTYTFAKPFNEKGLWQTKIGDEGKYLVKVTVSDGLLSTSEYVLVTLKRANRPPVIECPEKLSLKETETVVIDCNIYDPEGDSIIVGYDGWMRSATYKTTYGDAGEHTVVVRARDRNKETVEEVKINVAKTNRAPVIEDLKDATILETKSFKIDAKASDPDNDAVTLTYSDPFSKKGEWTPDFGDAGDYEITVTADDGADKATKTFKLTVTRMNRGPVLKEIDTVIVNEGETIRIPVSAYDPDGDNVQVTYSGWMTGNEYKTTYDDAFPEGCNVKGCTATYSVDVVASDGQIETKQTVEIKVVDKNRPPTFNG